MTDETTEATAAPSVDGADAQGFKRDVGTLGATTLIVGSAIGSGIFLLPSSIATLVPAPGMMLLVWVACGVLSLFGALTFAELGAAYPRAGGQYLFLKEIFGRRVAFLYGWTFFWVIQTGIIAAVAVAFALYVDVFWALGPFQVKLVAIALILGLSAVNYLGVRYGGIVGNVFTIAKVAAILAIVILGFTLADGTGELFSPFVPAGGATTGSLVSAFGAAMVLCLFAFDGWNQSAAIASEVRDPQRTVPRSMLLGVLVVLAVYLLANLVYLHVLPIDAIGGTSTLGADVARVFLGPDGESWIAAAILIATFGTVNAFILAGPRVYYAIAQDGLAYRGLGSIHERFKTPDFATIVQAQWACLLVLTGSYQQLVTYVVIAIYLFYGITAAGIFVNRRRNPGQILAYRTPGYPVIPVIFIATSAFIVLNAVFTTPREAFAGLGLVATGIPFLFLAEYMERRRRAREDTDGQPPRVGVEILTEQIR